MCFPMIIGKQHTIFINIQLYFTQLTLLDLYCTSIQRHKSKINIDCKATKLQQFDIQFCQEMLFRTIEILFQN